MATKAKHKHNYQRHIRWDGNSALPDCYDVVNVCSVCGKVKALPLKERLVKVQGGYRWLTHLDDIRTFFGDLPMLGSTERKEYKDGNST